MGGRIKLSKTETFLLALTALFLVTAVSVRLLTPRAAASQYTVEALTPSEETEEDRVNINTASASELDALPGIGPVLAQRIIDRYNLYPITVVQPQYNLNDRYIEHEIMGTCRKLGIGITTFSPLAQGLLTGKYRKGQPLPAGSRATWQSDHQINDLLTDENLDKVEQLRKVADELGTNLPVLSMAWILQHPEISCVIAGASKPSQLENNMKAAGFVIPADAMAEIDKITGFHRFERHVG